MSTTSSIITELAAINAALQVNGATRHGSFLDSQLFAAILGASSAVLTYAAARFLERPRIFVEARIGSTKIKKSVAVPVLVVEIFNRGERHVILKKLYLAFPIGRDLELKHPAAFVENKNKFPVKLEGRASHAIELNTGHFARTIYERAVYPTAVLFEDALGALHRAKTPPSFWEELFGGEPKQRI